jgi:hypothetical protein
MSPHEGFMAIGGRVEADVATLIRTALRYRMQC